jgi:uncharacterized protein involved in exopolysaccharide biosynthesis
MDGERGLDPLVAAERVSFEDLALVLARRGPLFKRFVGIGLIAALALAIVLPAEYLSVATVIREVDQQGGGSSGAALSALRGFGFDVGSSATGLTADAYPSLLQGREVRFAVVRDTFQLAGEEPMTFVEWVTTPQSIGEAIVKGIRGYTLGLPKKIMRAVAGPPTRTAVEGADVARYPTEAEERAMGMLGNMLTVVEESGSGLLQISVKSPDPALSAFLTERMVYHLIERVREVFTDKARRDLAFIEARFDEAGEELESAEAELAQFSDRNVGRALASVETERQRLRRVVTFKTQLYSGLQGQRTQTQIDLQRAEPVITVVEIPVPPLKPSGPNRLLIFIAVLMFSVILFGVTASVQYLARARRQDPEKGAKMDELTELVWTKPLAALAALRRRRKT